MPGANPPRVPEGLRDMMKSLTKEVLREKPSNIFEFSAQYFETMLHDGRDSPVRTYEPQESYDSIMKNRVKHQVPLSLVYSVVPESLTDLIKEFIKAVLRQKPKNICEFAVEYFRQQQMMKETQSTTSVDYTAYDNYFQKKDRYSYTSYVKCSCGRLLGNAAYESNYLNIKKTKLRQGSKTTKSSADDTSSICKIKHEQLEDEMPKTTAIEKTEKNKGIKYIKAVYVIQHHFRLYLARKRNISRKAMVPSSSTSSTLQESQQSKQREKLSMETAALVLQKAYRKFLKNNRLRNQKTLQEAALISNKISPQANMSMETAALIIQKAFHKFSNKRLHNNKLSKTTKMSKLETSNTEGEGDESNDNMSETASYTSASTALLSTESVGEHFDLNSGNEEGVLHQTIQEDEEVENDNQNTITLNNKKKLKQLKKDDSGKISDIKGSTDVSKLSANNKKEIKLETNETENNVELNESAGKNSEVIAIVKDSLRTINDGIVLESSHKDKPQNDKNSSLNEKNNLIKNVNENSENLGNIIQETTKDITEGMDDAMKSDSLIKTHSVLSNSLDEIGKSIKIKSVIEGEEDYEITIDNSEKNIGISLTTDTNENQDNDNNVDHSIDLEDAPDSVSLHKTKTEGIDSKVNNNSSKEEATVDPIMGDDNHSSETLLEKMENSEISVEDLQKAKPINSKTISQQESVDKLKSNTKDDEKEEISKDASIESNVSHNILKTSESAQLLLNSQNIQLSDVSELKSLDGDKVDREEDLLKGTSTSELLTNNQSLKETTQMFIDFEQNNEVPKEKTIPVEDTGTSETDRLLNTILESSDHVNEAKLNEILNDQSKGEVIEESELEVVDSQKLDSLDQQIVSEPPITKSSVSSDQENEDKNKLKEDSSPSSQELSTSDQNLNEQETKTPSKYSENLQPQDDVSENDNMKSAKSKSKFIDPQRIESIEKQIISVPQKLIHKEIENMNKLEERPLQEVSISDQNLFEEKISGISENIQPSDDKSKDDTPTLQDLSTTPSDKTMDEQILKRERRALNDSNVSDSVEESIKLNIPENDDSKIEVASDDKRKDASEETSSSIKLDNEDSDKKVESVNERKVSSERSSSLMKSENDFSTITDASHDKGKDSSLGKTRSLNTPDNEDSKTTNDSFDVVKPTNVTSDPETISLDKSIADGREETLKDSDLSETKLDEQNQSSLELSKNDESTNVASDKEPPLMDSNEKKAPSSQIEDNTEEKLKEDDAHQTNSIVKDQIKEEPSISADPIIDGSENSNSTILESNTKPQLRDTTKVNSQDSKAEASASVSSDSILNEDATEIVIPKSSVDDTQNLTSNNSDTKNIEHVLEHSKPKSLSNEQNEEKSPPSKESLRESLSLNSNDNLDDKILTEELMQGPTSATMEESKPERKSSANSSQELNLDQPNVELLDSVQTNKSLENAISKEDDQKEDTILSKQILEKEEGLPQSGITSEKDIPHTESINLESVLKSSEIDNTNADQKSHVDRETSKENLIQKIDSSDGALSAQNVGENPEKSTSIETLVDHIQNETLTEVKDTKDLLTVVDNLETNNKSSKSNELKQDLIETVSNEQTVKASAQKSGSSDPPIEIIENTMLSEEDGGKCNEEETKESHAQKNVISSSILERTSQSENIVQFTELETNSGPNENSNEDPIVDDERDAQGAESSKEFVKDSLNGEQQSLNKSNSDSSDNRSKANVKSSQDDGSTESNESSRLPRSAGIKTAEEKSEFKELTELKTKSDILNQKKKSEGDMSSEENKSQKSETVEHEVATKSNSLDDVERTEDMSSKEDESQKSGNVKHEVATKSNSNDDVEKPEDMSSKEESQKSGNVKHEVATKSNSNDDVEGTDSKRSSKNRPGIGPSEKIKDKHLRGSKQKVDDLSSTQIDDNKTIGTSKLSENSNNKLTHASMLPNSKKLHSSNQKDKKVDYSSGRLIPAPIAELQLKSFKTPANAGPWYEVHVEKPKEEEKNSNVKSEVHQNNEQSMNESQREEEHNSNLLNEEYQNDEESIFGNEITDSQSETSSYESNKSTLDLLYAYHLNHELRYNSEISGIERLIGLMQAADQDVSYLKDPLDYTSYSKDEERIPQYLNGIQSQENTPSTNNKSSISFFVPFDSQDNESAKSKKHSKQNLQKLDIKGNNEIQPTTSKEILSQSMIEDSLDEIMEMDEIIINETMPGKSLLQTIPEQNENESPSPRRSLDRKSILVLNESETSENRKENNSQNLSSEPNSSTQNPILIDNTENDKPNDLESVENMIVENDAIKRDIEIDLANEKESPNVGQLSIDSKPTSRPQSVDKTSDKSAENHGGLDEKIQNEISKIVQNFNSSLEGANKSDGKDGKNDELKETSENDSISDENEPQEAILPEVTYSEDDKKDNGVHGKEHHKTTPSDISEQIMKAALPESIISNASMEKTEIDKPEDKMDEKSDENKEKEGGEIYDNIQGKNSHEITSSSSISEQNLKPALSGSIKSEHSIEESANVKPADLENIHRAQSVDKLSAKDDETDKLKEDGEKDSEMHEIVTSEINELKLSSAKPSNAKNEKDNDSKDFKEDSGKDEEEVHEVITSVLPGANNSESSIDETENVEPTDLVFTRKTRSDDIMSVKGDENEEFKESGEIYDKNHEKQSDQLANSDLNKQNLRAASMDQAENSKGSEEKINEENSGDEMHEEDPHISDINEQNLNLTLPNVLYSDPLMKDTENIKQNDLKDTRGLNKMSENSEEIEEYKEGSKEDVKINEEGPQEMTISELNVAVPKDTISKEETENVDVLELQSANTVNENEIANKEFKKDDAKYDVLEEVPNKIVTSALKDKSVKEDLAGTINSNLSMDETDDLSDLKDTHKVHLVNKLNEKDDKTEEFNEGGERNDKIPERESHEIASSDINEQNLNSALPEANNSELSMEDHKIVKTTKLDVSQSIDKMSEKGEENEEIYEEKSYEISSLDVNEQKSESSLPEGNNSELSMEEPKIVKTTKLDVSQSIDKITEKGEENKEIYEEDSNEIASSDVNEQNSKSSLPEGNNSKLSTNEPKSIQPTDLEIPSAPPSVGEMSEKVEENEEYKEGSEINNEKESVNYDLKEQNVKAEQFEATNSKSLIERTENTSSVDLEDIREPQSVDQNELDKISNENVREQDDRMFTKEPEVKKLRSTNSDTLIEKADNLKSTDFEETHGQIDKMNIENEGNEISEDIEKNEGIREETIEITKSELEKQNLNSLLPGATKSESLVEEPENVKSTDIESKSSQEDKLNKEIDETVVSKRESLKGKNTKLEKRSTGESSEGDNMNQQIDNSNIKDGNNEWEIENELSGKTKLDSESSESIKENSDTSMNNDPLNLKILQENDLQNHETDLKVKVGNMSDMARRIAAAIVIQRAFRRFLEIKTNKKAIENSTILKEIAENEAALVIQKAFRQYIYNISHKKQSESNLETSNLESFENTKEHDNKSENSSIETSPSVSQITQIYKMKRSESQVSTDTIGNLSNVDYLDGSDNKLDSPKSKWFVGNEPIESVADAHKLNSVDSSSLSNIDTNSSDSEKLLVIADTEPQLVACLNNVDDSNLKSNLSIGNNIIGEENGESVEETNENSKNNDLAGLREDESQTSESGSKDNNNAMIQNDESMDIKFETKIDEADTTAYEEMLVEVIEKPCIKKIVSKANPNEIESEENEESKKDIKSAESPESEAESDVILKTIETDSLVAATEKLSKADEAIEKMFSRRLSETKLTPSLSETTFKEPSFEEPVIRPMSALHEHISIDLEETDIVVLNRLQREDTRESSAQSDAIVFGENNLETDELDALENIEVTTHKLKRLYTIAGDDTSIIFKSVTIDETVKYIDPPNSSTSATSGSSFCLDDDISENIRQKMMAYSLSEADSDYFEGNNDGPDNSVDRSAVRNDDFNISTALADTTGTSTETESTIVSAATKIQAGARGFLTRRRLRRLSGGTTTSNQETKASFGNDAISESLERFIEDEAAKKIQFAYRNHYYKKGKLNNDHHDHDDDDDNVDEGASLDNSLAARRLTLQRGDALRNDSTPDEEHNDNGNNAVKMTYSSSTARSKPLGDYRLKPWTAMRQNSLPVQIDTNIFRVLPKQLSKRIKSAENEKKPRRITTNKRK